MTYKEILIWYTMTWQWLPTSLSSCWSCTCQICANFQTPASRSRWSKCFCQISCLSSSLYSSFCLISFFMSLSGISLLVATTLYPLTLLTFIHSIHRYLILFRISKIFLAYNDRLNKVTSPTPQDVHVLISRTYTLHHEKNFPNTIKLRILWWWYYPGLSIWVQCNHEGH